MSLQNDLMTLEEQIWADMVQRKLYASAKTVAKKLGISTNYVRKVLEKHHQRQALDKIVRAGTNYYRIKD